MDLGLKNYIDTFDIVAFMRDNNSIVTEDDAYLLMNHLDRDKDGKLGISDLTILLASPSFDYRKKIKGTKTHYDYGASIKKVSYDIEYAVFRVLELELELLIEIEQIKQELMTLHDWS